MFSTDGSNPGLKGLKTSDEIGVDYVDVTVKVPSECKAYPEGTKIYVRPYYFAEVKNMNAVFEASNSVIDIYEKACSGIRTVGITPDQLILGDFLYLSFLRKVHTLGGSKFNVIVTINDTPYSGELSVSDIGFEQSEAPKFPVKAKMGSDKVEVSFWPVSVGEYVDFLRKNDGECPDELDELKIASRHSHDDIIDRLHSAQDQLLATRVRKLIDYGVAPIQSTLKNMLNKEEERLEYHPDSLDALIFPVNDPDQGSVDDELSFG